MSQGCCEEQSANIDKALGQYLARWLLHLGVGHYYHLPSTVAGKLPSTADREGLNKPEHVHFPFLYIFTVSCLITPSLTPPQKALRRKTTFPTYKRKKGNIFAIPGKNPYLTLDFCPDFLSAPLVTLLEGVRVSSEAQLCLRAGYPGKKP